jgi:hypothetical protein
MSVENIITPRMSIMQNNTTSNHGEISITSFIILHFNISSKISFLIVLCLWLSFKLLVGVFKGSNKILEWNTLL